MSKNNGTILPKKRMSTGAMLIAVGITLSIVVIAIVLIVTELEKWKQFQTEIGNPSLLKTILVRI